MRDKSYTSIFKATTLFGLVQIISIIISIIKSKLVALWIGTTGFGIISIFNSSTSLISSITNLGIQSSAVREIASNSEDKRNLSLAIEITKKLALYTSFLGAFLTVLLSPCLSLLFFHSYDYTYSFILLALVIFFTGMYNQYYATFQGIRQLKNLAISTIIGSFVGLLLSIPCFFILREDGIIPSLIVSSLALMLISSYYVRKASIDRSIISFKDVVKQGKPIVKLGIFIAISNNVTFLTMFIIKAYISNISTVEEVGLFQAGWSLNAQYIGLILTAMSKDYFPRLSKVASNDKLASKTMNEQGEVGLLLLVPMLAIMLTFVKTFILILYSNEFLAIIPMTKLLLLGTIIQIAGWGVGYIFLAKNDGKTYFYNEVGTRVLLLPLYIFGYKIYGLKGLGFAFIINQIMYLVIVIAVSHFKYSIDYSKKYLIQLIIILLIMSAYIIVDNIFSPSIYIKVAFCIISCIYSLVIFNAKMGIFKLKR